MNTFTPLTSAALATLLALAMSGANAAGDSMSGSSMSGGSSNQLSQQQQQQFQRLDTNNDGKISQDEAQADPQLSQQFSSADSDSDKNISKGEFAQFEAQSGSGQSQGGQSPTQ